MRILLSGATGFVGRAAASDRGSASGLYLASYFLGGLAGSAVLGQMFDRLGWTACVIGIGTALYGLLAHNLLHRVADVILEEFKSFLLAATR